MGAAACVYYGELLLFNGGGGERADPNAWLQTR
jgi:hypothetical protein